jgi:sugar phosphate isomerase/epimerase
MKLSISNIAWEADADDFVYRLLEENGYQGLEIAPTRIFPENPYGHIPEAKVWADSLRKDYGLVVSSMQSIWYGHSEKIFGSTEERQVLLDYTKQAILFAEAIGCGNLVFGNPKNRDTDDIDRDFEIALAFFRNIGEFAYDHNTILALEPNPIIYNTRFMNTTVETVRIVEAVNSKGIKLNVDLGAMIFNNEDLEYLSQIPQYINHVHISEPGLKLIERRPQMHGALLGIARRYFDNVFVSIEMGKQKIEDVGESLKYLANLSGII